jgi:hypothetical protein
MRSTAHLRRRALRREGGNREGSQEASFLGGSSWAPPSVVKDLVLLVRSAAVCKGGRLLSLDKAGRTPNVRGTVCAGAHKGVRVALAVASVGFCCCCPPLGPRLGGIGGEKASLLQMPTTRETRQPFTVSFCLGLEGSVPHIPSLLRRGPEDEHRPCCCSYSGRWPC